MTAEVSHQYHEPAPGGESPDRHRCDLRRSMTEIAALIRGLVSCAQS
jgi:hypothetical protein